MTADKKHLVTDGVAQECKTASIREAGNARADAIEDKADKRGKTPEVGLPRLKCKAADCSCGLFPSADTPPKGRDTRFGGAFSKLSHMPGTASAGSRWKGTNPS